MALWIRRTSYSIWWWKSGFAIGEWWSWTPDQWQRRRRRVTTLNWRSRAIHWRTRMPVPRRSNWWGPVWWSRLVTRRSWFSSMRLMWFLHINRGKWPPGSWRYRFAIRAGQSGKLIGWPVTFGWCVSRSCGSSPAIAIEWCCPRLRSRFFVIPSSLQSKNYYVHLRKIKQWRSTHLKYIRESSRIGGAPGIFLKYLSIIVVPLGVLWNTTIDMNNNDTSG